MGGVHGYGVGSSGDVDISAPLGTFGNTGGHRQDLDSAGAYVVADEVAGTLGAGAWRGKDGGGGGMRDDPERMTFVAVAGPEGEDLSHAVGAANPNRHDPTFQTYVVPADEHAATLTGGGHPNSNEPGRKREDDVNLVVEEPQAFDWQQGSRDVRLDDAAELTRTDGSPAVLIPAQEAFVVEPESGQGADLRARPVDVAPALTSKNEGVAGYDRGVRVVEASAFDLRGREEGARVEEQGDEASALRAAPGGSSRSYVAFRQTPQGDLGMDKEQAYPVMNNDGTGNNRTLLAAVNEDGTLNPHHYFPDYEAMGDCATCGNVEGASIHDRERIAAWEADVAATLKGQRGKGGGGIGPEETLVAAKPYAKLHGASDTEDDEHWDEAEVARTQNGLQHATEVVVEDVAQPVRSNVYNNSDPSMEASMHVRTSGSAVRRLTPSECEALQGFPRGWTAIDGDATPDGPRYAALGDAVTVNAAYWIVARIMRKVALT